MRYIIMCVLALQDVRECDVNYGGCDVTSEMCVDTYGSHYCILRALTNETFVLGKENSYYHEL